MILVNRCEICGLLYDPAIHVVECAVCHAPLYKTEMWLIKFQNSIVII